MASSHPPTTVNKPMKAADASNVFVFHIERRLLIRMGVTIVELTRFRGVADISKAESVGAEELPTRRTERKDRRPEMATVYAADMKSSVCRLKRGLL